MTQTQLERIDLALRVRGSADGTATLEVQAGGKSARAVLSAKTLDSARKRGRAAALIDKALLRPVLEAWRAQAPAGAPEHAVRRIILELQGPGVAGLDWEAALAPHLKAGEHVVRTSPVRARVLNLPFTPPLRILQVGARQGTSLSTLFEKLLGGHKSAQRAVQTERCAISAVDRFLLTSKWATGDVLQFDDRSGWSKDELLSAGDPERPGTLGWLQRLTDTWQTRLIVLIWRDPASVARARELASAVVARAGPAVLLLQPESRQEKSLLTQLYQELIQDRPLDSLSILAPDKRGRMPALFAGGGREDALRFSEVAARLASPKEARDIVSSIREQLIREQPRRPSYPVQPRPPFLGGEHVGPTRPGGWTNTRGIHIRPESLTTGADGWREPSEKAAHELMTRLESFGESWNEPDFPQQSRGLVKLSESLDALRREAGILEPQPLSANLQSKVPARTTRERFVNPSLWVEETGGLRRLEQNTAPLATGELYHLGIQIGPRDFQELVVGNEALLREIEKLARQQDVWLDVGVIGMDFEVLGHAVQQILLPPEGPTELIRFAIRPRESGLARLRFCIYYRSTLLHSYRLAAFCAPRSGKGTKPKAPRRQLAEALDLPMSQVAVTGYLWRLEYRVSDLSPQVARQPERAVSIVANDLGDGPVVSVKAGETFDTSQNGALPELVKNVRDTLEQLSTFTPDPKNPKLRRYAFGKDGELNAGQVEQLKEALKRLATVGYQLYDAVIAPEAREGLEKTLAGEPRIIHIAHILLEKALPWAAIYDRYYDAGNQSEPHEVCLAPLKPGGGPTMRCGEHPDCPRNEARRKGSGKPSDKVIVCPLGFWGFRHLLELPPLQVPPGESGEGKTDSVESTRPANVVAGAHGDFVSLERHLKDLGQIICPPECTASHTCAARMAKPMLYKRDEILSALDDQRDLDIIYFFCHAAARNKDGRFDPYLEFKPPKGAPGTITASQLTGSRWTHRPLVILNGCGTVGFSPEALSPFIVKLVRGRGAAGVLGTEIPVWEQLAGELASQFLARFTQGRTWAAVALRDARWALLVKNNPLGLAYTLYASADLTLSKGTKAWSLQ